MSKIILNGFIVVPEDDIQGIRAALSEHITLTRKEPGCIKFDVVQRENAPNIFDVYEEFIDKDAFEFHQNRVKNSFWGDVSSNVERHYAIREDGE